VAIKNGFKRFLALILCLLIPCGVCTPSAKADEDFLLQLFLMALLEEYGLTDIADLMALIDVEGMEELYELYDEWYGYYGSDDAAYYSDDGYPIYLDEKTGYYYGLYTDHMVYIDGYSKSGTQKDLIVPAYVDGYPVYDIAPYAFEGMKGIGRVVLGEGIKGIDESAFAGCDVQTLVLPDSLEFIEYNAFSECSNLREISFSEGIEYIGVAAFADCTSLQKVVLPDSVIELGYDAFWGCNSLKTVHIGSGLSVMDGNVFFDAPIKNFTISEKNRIFRMKDGALYNTVEKSIVRYFGAIDSAAEFAVPSGIVTVEYGCFADTNGLKRVTLPDTVKTIGDYAFYGCDQCEFFGLGNGLTTLGDAAIPTNLLRGIQLPSSLTSIEDMSLYIWTDAPTAYDELWVVAYDGSHAARWAEEQGYSVYPPSEAVLVIIGALEEKSAYLTVTPQYAVPGETVVLDLDINGYQGDKVRFVIEGEELGQAELNQKTVRYEFAPSASGVYTISALVGRETVDYAQLIVWGDENMTIESIPETCYHEYAHIGQADYEERTLTDTGLADKHQLSLNVYRAWVCSRCKAYCIEEDPYKSLNNYVPHEAEPNGFCLCGQRITEGVDEVMLKDGMLSSYVRCYTREGCRWYFAPGEEAGGILESNMALKVTGFKSGYAMTTLSENGSTVYIPAGLLSLLPLNNPELFGLHKDLTLDGKRLSQIPSEELLYEYYREVRLWDNYLYDLTAYENSRLDAAELNKELVVELYQISMGYHDTMMAVGGVDMLIDLEAFFELDLFGSFEHLKDTLEKQMPSLDAMMAFATMIGYQDYLQEYNKATGFIGKLDDLMDLVEDKKDFYENLSYEEREEFDEFFDDIDDLPIIDVVDDLMEELLDTIGSSKAWKTIKPLLGKGTEITGEVMNLLGLIMPYLELIVTYATLENFFDTLSPAQKAVLKWMSETDDDPYIAMMADYALNFSDKMGTYFKSVLKAHIKSEISDALLGTCLVGRAYKVGTGLGGLLMNASGMVGTITGAWDEEVQRYMAYETVRLGVGVEISERLRSLPERPNEQQLTELKWLTEEYIRLMKMIRSNKESAFGKKALEEIERCLLYAPHAPASMPQKPTLLQYQP